MYHDRAGQQGGKEDTAKWPLFLAVGGLIVMRLMDRRETTILGLSSYGSAEPATAGLSESQPVPWGKYALAGTAGYLGGKVVEAWLSAPSIGLVEPSQLTSVTQPGDLIGSPTKKDGQIDWASLLSGPSPGTAARSATSAVSKDTLWTPPPDSEWLNIVRHPAVVLTIGGRGAGKSALDYRLVELLRPHGAPYVVGLPDQAHKYLPDWMGTAARLEDVPEGAIALLDESYLQHHARTSMSEAGRSIGNLINLSRQRRQTLLFVVQEARQLDVNVVSQVDVLAVKEVSELSQGFERPQIRRFTDKARAAFAAVDGDKRKWTWVYSETARFEGLIRNELPTFWTPRLSHAYAQETPVSTSSLRRGKRSSREEMKFESKKMHASDFSYAYIARTLGISKTMAWNLVNED